MGKKLNMSSTLSFMAITLVSEGNALPRNNLFIDLYFNLLEKKYFIEGPGIALESGNW